jgi:hypothetical protein
VFCLKLDRRCFVTLWACIVFADSCGRSSPRKEHRDGERIDLSQGITRNSQHEDLAFKNFKTNWRDFINPSPEVAFPVVRPAHETEWQPMVTQQCVFSAEARGLVPEVALSWQESPTEASATRRIDLTLHHDGFSRNYYSTALTSDKGRRFRLPANSALINDEEAVLLTGPGMFPKLIDFRAENLKERETSSQFSSVTLLVRDLSPGLTYTIRMSSLRGKEWQEDRRFVFLTPVCPNSF